MDPARRRALESLRSNLRRSKVGAACSKTRGSQQLIGIQSTSLGLKVPKAHGFKRFHSASVKLLKKSSTATTKAKDGTKVHAPSEYGTGVGYLEIDGYSPFNPAFLRDACECQKCVDPSSKQKNFQTTDIPDDIRAKSVDTSPEGAVEIVWENDIPGFEQGHKSVYTKPLLASLSSGTAQRKARFGLPRTVLWDKKIITKHLEYVDYEDYMKTDEALFRAVKNLHSHGLLLLRGVPNSEKSVEEIAIRIGNLRDSLYGRTWDVKSVPQAKNVAYTAQYLGLHMDLLYMSDPPGFQFLHCIQNTCKGGASLFSDAMHAASRLPLETFITLCRTRLAYHYKNAGEHYYFQHPLIQVLNSSPSSLKAQRGMLKEDQVQFINYSPPFQANHVSLGSEGRSQREFPALLRAMKEFAELVESEESLYEYRLQEGECVIFNNRRVLHGRRQFDTTTGSRWLKGAYIDTDVFMSKFRVLSEKFEGPVQAVWGKRRDSKESKVKPKFVHESSRPL